MKGKKEIRTSKHYEIRAEEKDGKRVVQATIPYNSRSEDMGFIEYLRPGCFRKTINDGYNVRALYQHDGSAILGAVKNGTLSLSDSDASLNAEIILPDTQEARDVFNLIRDGYIEHCSFGFRAIKDEWTEMQNGQQERAIIEAHLFEISPVTFPAYQMTQVSASLRNLKEYDIDPEALEQAIEERDKEKIKTLLSPLFDDSQEEAGAAEEPAAEGTGIDPALYDYDLDGLLL